MEKAEGLMRPRGARRVGRKGRGGPLGRQIYAGRCAIFISGHRIGCDGFIPEIFVAGGYEIGT